MSCELNRPLLFARHLPLVSIFCVGLVIIPRFFRLTCLGCSVPDNCFRLSSGYALYAPPIPDPPSSAGLQRRNFLSWVPGMFSSTMIPL